MAFLKYNYDELIKITRDVKTNIKLKIVKQNKNLRGKEFRNSYWKFSEVIFDIQRKKLQCHFIKSKTKKSYAGLISSGDFLHCSVIDSKVTFSVDEEKVENIFECSDIMSGLKKVKVSMSSDRSEEHKMNGSRKRKKIMREKEKDSDDFSSSKKKRGRKSKVELLCGSGTCEQISREYKHHAIASTHKSVIIQKEIKKILESTGHEDKAKEEVKEEEEKEIFFKNLSEIIFKYHPHVAHISKKPLRYTDPPVLPEDILSIRTKQTKNNFTFTNTRQARNDIIPQGSTFLYDFENFWSIKRKLFEKCEKNDKKRYIQWPPYTFE